MPTDINNINNGVSVRDEERETPVDGANTLASFSQRKRLFIIAGDPSGDMHAAAVVQELKSNHPSIQIAAVGGEALRNQGVYLLSDQKHMGAIGAALGAIPHHIQLARQIIRFLDHFQPDGVLFIDYGGFNLRLAPHLKKRNHRLFYFIPPQVWASRQRRIQTIQNTMDHVFCIFPFEEDLYRQREIPVTYVGHPLASQLPARVDRNAFCHRHGLDPKCPIVTLLPGSRKMEIQHLLQPILESLPFIHQQERQQGRSLLQHRENHSKPDEEAQSIQFVLAKSPSVDPKLFQKILQKVSLPKAVSLTILEGHSREALSLTDAAIVASGTATLEAALYSVPMVIVYKGPWLVYQIAKRVCVLPSIGLPNVLMDPLDRTVPELWQYEVNGPNIAKHLLPMLNPQSAPYQKAMVGFQVIQQKIGHRPAAKNVAQTLLTLLSTSSKPVPVK